MAAVWTVVLCLTLARFLATGQSVTQDDAPGCFPDLTDAWASWWIRLYDSETQGLRVAAAAIGVLAARSARDVTPAGRG
ncbi:hypothetical protein Nocox_24470 [Nonomuraea coxensis DSM 45129]|uniref:Uncharacterized protein n=1 Tax=Nonomuraea coxensis DSM 45129 TaxID=1122611 RepID=A0ABX8U429_9ACTN|nr:hypothetical protein [Nonomuraea coxensis]QYC42497.1 hypothetical protein Nocox_24470 [Nonomuraea coxensis DSM 45129]